MTINKSQRDMPSVISEAIIIATYEVGTEPKARSNKNKDGLGFTLSFARIGFCGFGDLEKAALIISQA